MKGFSGEVIAGRYRLDRAIGAGGFGTVWAGRQINLDRAVAVKVMRQGPESAAIARERFRREALWSSGLSHPNVVVYHDFLVDEDDDMMLVMEYLEGFTLDELLKSDERLDVFRAVKCIAETARGLAEAHRAGIVHRDVKPSNIFVVHPGTRRERAKLIDFGILWADPGVKGDHRELTRRNAFIGTPEYVAPEVLIGARVTGATDQYALALVALKAITGQKPWPETSGPELLARLASRPRLLESALIDGRQALKGVLFKALSPEPGDRFADMDAFADALEDALACEGAFETDGTTVSQGLRDGLESEGRSGGSAWMAGPDRPAAVSGRDSGGQRKRGFSVAWIFVLALVVMIGAGFAVFRSGLFGGQNGGFVALSGGVPSTDVISGGASTVSGGDKAGVDERPLVRDAVGMASAEVGVPAAQAGEKVAKPEPVVVEDVMMAPDASKVAEGTDSGRTVKPSVKRRNRPSNAAGSRSKRPRRVVKMNSRSDVTHEKQVESVPLIYEKGGQTGILHVNAEPWALVTIDGRPMGRTPVKHVELMSGRHKIVYEHPELGRIERVYSIEPGSESRKSVVMGER